MLAMLLALSLATAAAATEEPMLNPVQHDVMRRLARRAEAASNAATGGVLASLDDPGFRRLLRTALPPGTTTLDPTAPAAEILSRFRAEVAVAEAVHSFRATPFSTEMSVVEVSSTSGAVNLWELALAAAARGNGSAAARSADHSGFGGMNAAEEGLYGFPAFTGRRTDDPAWAAGVWPANAAEARARPIYSTLNLRKIDGGNDIFGPVGMVFRQASMANRTILAPVDTGCFQYLCNSSWYTTLCRFFAESHDCNAAWTGKECAWQTTTNSCHVDIRLPAANCSQWDATGGPKQSFAGTPAHFDHLIMPSARWWNGSTPTTWRQNLVGQLARMFRHWPHALNQSGSGWSQPDFQPATSDENFWEAEVLAPRYPPPPPPVLRITAGDATAGLSRVSAPPPLALQGDVKMILALFGGPEGLFATAAGRALRKLCEARGWPLVWALGPAQPGSNMAVNPSNQRLLDPFATGGAGANLSLPVAASKVIAASVWASLAAGGRRDYGTVSHAWRKLRSGLDPKYRLEPLYGLSCADVDCIGIVEGTADCVCFGSHRHSSTTLKSDDSSVPGPTMKSDDDSVGRILKTEAAFFIEADVGLVRGSSVHDRLWNGVRTIAAPMTMYMPWAPFPHYAVGELTAPTKLKQASDHCQTSWNMSVVDSMAVDFFNATSFFNGAKFVQFSQSPCWMWKDGDCSELCMPQDINQLTFPHKCYASGKTPVDASYRQIADYFGRLAAWYRSGGFIDECGARHTSPHNVSVGYWGVENEGEHIQGVESYTKAYDAILRSIKTHEVGGEAPMKYVSINQNFGPAEAEVWLRYFLNRTNHDDPDVQIDVISFHGYFHGGGNELIATPELCRANCTMVNESVGTHFHGKWKALPPGKRPSSLAQCNEACLHDSTCVQMTWAPQNIGHPEGACVLYTSISNQPQRSACQAAAKCAAESTEPAVDCAAFAPGPPPPPEGVCDTWGLKSPSELETVFPQVDKFMTSTVDAVIALRDELAPTVGLALGEFGVTLRRDIDSSCHQVVAEKPEYQLMAAAVFGYGFGQLAERGIDFVLQSQYTGHAAGGIFEGRKLDHNYYPGLALYNWSTGALQPRSVVNQIIVAHLEPGVDRIMPSNYSGDAALYALGFSSPTCRKLLLVNKAATSTVAPLDKELQGGTMYVVDEFYVGAASPRVVTRVGGEVTLTAFATAVIVGPQAKD